MLDPGLLATAIFGGIAIAGAGGSSLPVARRLQAWRRARLEAQTPWTTHREHHVDGSTVLSIQRRAGDRVYQREHVRSLPAGTSELDVDVARWEAKSLAEERNKEEGRRVRP